MKDYKDRPRAKKMMLLDEKAKEMGIHSGVQLLTWYEGMCTRLGKLTKKKSRDRARELTDRQQWVLDELNFLLHHISRAVGWQAVNVIKKIVIFTSFIQYLAMLKCLMFYYILMFYYVLLF